MATEDDVLDLFPDDIRSKGAVAFRDLASGLYSVSGGASIGKKTLYPLSLWAKTDDGLKKKISDLEKKIKAVEKAANYLDDKPLVGPIAKALKPLASGLEFWAKRTKEQIGTLSDTQVKVGKVVEPIYDTLSKIDKYALKAGIASDLFSRKLAVAGQQLADAKQLFDTDIPFYGNDTRMNQRVLLQIGIAQGDAAKVADEIADLQNIIAGIESAVSGLNDFSDNDIFTSLLKFKETITKIGNTLSPIFSPIQKVYEALEPVLDALDSIFGWFLKPLEWILDAVIEGLGINKIIEAAANELLKILPDPGLLDNLIKELERVFIKELQDYYDEKIKAPFAALEAKLSDIEFPSQFAKADDGDNTLFGGLNMTGSLNLNGLGGNDILLGGAFDDILRGGAGADVLIGGGGNDLLDGGTNPDGEPDMVVYTGSFDDYNLISVLEDGFNNGTWYVIDTRTDISVAGITDQVHFGTDELKGIEVIVFDDMVLDLSEFDTLIRTKSKSGEKIEVGPNYTDLPDLVLPNGTIVPQVTADGGVDLIYGALGLDFLITAAGNDQLYSGSNTQETFEKQQSPGDWLYGGLGNDVYIIDTYSGTFDLIVDEGGNDLVDYRKHESVADEGLTVFLGSTAREMLYRPTSVEIDADYNGRPLTGSLYNVGIIRGIENITGTKYADFFIGNDAINKIIGGDGNDQIRGLGGNDILLGGAGNDTLIGDGGNDHLDGGSGSNTYIGSLGDDYIYDIASSYSTVKYSAFAQTSHYNKSIKFTDFTTTGFSTYNEYDLPGSIVIVPTFIPGEQQVSKYNTSVNAGDRYGVDYLEGIEIIVGSIGGDVIYSSGNINQTIYSNDGNDTLYSGVGDTQNRFYAGPGDDFFVSDFHARDTFFGGAGSDTVRVWDDNTVEGDLLFGDDNRQTALDGEDVLDLSQSDFSWHFYMQPGSGGRLTGKDPMTALHDEDPKFIQPTLGVNGVVEKYLGVVFVGESYPGINFVLRVADANTNSPGGVASVSEFEKIIGSQHRDFITGGNPDGPITVEGQGGDDVLYASQIFAAHLDGGDGNDVLGTYNHTLHLETVQNFFDVDKRTVLIGGMGDDTFVAGDFQEEIDGGEGLDELTYEVSTSGVTVNLDTKTLDRGYATGDILIGGIVNVTGSQFDDIITGDDLANQLVGWEGADILRGLDGHDVLFGDEGADQLFGGGGNDILHGGNGADLMDGGTGNDTASWNLFQVHPKGGLDRLTNDTTGVTADLVTGEAGLDTLVSIENLYGGVGDDEFYGSDVDNFLGGNLGDDFLDGRGGDDVLLGSKGDDTIYGGSGNDYLSGGAGTNLLFGGEGIDSIDYSSLDFGVVITMAGVGIRTGFDTGEADSRTPIEFHVWSDAWATVINTKTGLPLTESDLKSLLIDPVSGLPIVDPETNLVLVDTTTGSPYVLADLLAKLTETRYTYQRFDQGNDDPSDDIFTQEDPITPERIWKINPFFAETPEDLEGIRYLSSDGLLPEQEVTELFVYEKAYDLFSSIERIIGSKGDDNFIGNSEDTFFYGGLGGDTILGGGGIDTSSYEHSAAGVTVDMQNLKFFGGDADGDTLEEIENLVGSAFSDMLGGNAFDNRLTLGTGNDTARGGDGEDTAVFEFANTDLIVHLAADGLHLIRHDDEIVLSDDFIGDDIELLEFTNGTFTYDQIFALAVTGTDGDDLLIGTPIGDPIDGKGGNDIIEGRESDDTLDGGADDDLLEGEGGNDLLIGGTGTDRFIGGLGDDTFVLDDPNEIVTEFLDEGFDTIVIDQSITLPDNVEALLLTGVGPTTGTGNALINVLTGSDGDNTLVGLGGNDRLDGGVGADTMIGGTGSDLYVVDNIGDVVIELANDAGYDTIITTVDYTAPENVEQLVVSGGAGLTLIGNAHDNTFVDGVSIIEGNSDPLDGTGSSTFDGGEGRDIAIFKYDFASSIIGVDAEGFVTITNGDQTDRVRGIELLDFTDVFRTIDQIRPGISLFAGDRYETDYPIDMTPEGGGKQFLYTGPRNTGDNTGNKSFFVTEFEHPGKAFFEGSGLKDHTTGSATGTVSRVVVDFSGGNTSQMSVGGIGQSLQTMIDADWLFYQNVIFGASDRVVGSYYDDKLVGYRGDDTIFGGLGDKESYNVETGPFDSTTSTLRNPGDLADSAYFVDDGDDFIDGREGHDLLDGGTGNDTILGGEGDDVLFGGGGLFSDRLFGGIGDDTLTGGEGVDTFVLDMGMDGERVLDFEIGIDILDYYGLSGAELAALTITTQDGDTLITLSDGSVMTLVGVELTDLPLLPVQVITPDDLNGRNGFQVDISIRKENFSFSGVGDINNDGFDDFAIGWAQTISTGLFPISYVVYGKEEPFDPLIIPYFHDETEGFAISSEDGSRGIAISSAGDFNNDGIDDLIIGHLRQAHIVYGRDSDSGDGFGTDIFLDSLTPSQGLQIDIGKSGASSQFVTGGFDLNNDGIDDVVIGAAHDIGSSGAVYVVFGSDDPFPATIDETYLDGTTGFKLNGTGGFTYTGETVAPAGDVNGDGIDDLIIGVPFHSVDKPDGLGGSDLIGGSFVVYGSDAAFAAEIDVFDMSADQGFEIAGDFAATGQGRTGRNVQGGGDVNGDGIDDLVVGVGWAFHETGEVAERAYVIYGQQGGFGEIFYLADIDGDNGTVFTLDIPEGYVIPYTGPNANIQDDFVNYLGAVSIDIVADINNDRLDDIVIGTFTRERTVIHNPDDHFDSSDVTETTGKTFVLYGDQGGYGTSFDLNTLASGEGFIVDGVAYDGSGRVATSAGDINGDGGGDIFLGATNAPSLILFGDPFMNLPVTGSVLITGLAKEGETLTSEFNTIDDGDGVGELQLQWLRDGGAIAENGDGLDYTLTNADVGKTISLEVSFIDGSGTLEKVTSAETLLVENVNDLPVAVDDIANGDEDDPLIINVLANDTDEDISDTLFVSAVTQGESGAVVANADGTVTYTPDQEFSGVDSFTYTASDGNGGSSTANVDVTIDIVNDAPIAGEDSITLDEDGTDTVSVLDNDSDVDSASFELIGTTDGAKVTVTHLGNGLIEVTGKENAIGTDSFTYTLRDSGGATSTGTVQVTLNPVNDVPTPQDDLSSWTEDRTLIVNVIDNDTDPDGDTLTVVGVEDGQFTTAILNDDQTITVIPDPDFAGTDFVTYTVRDPGGLEQTAELKVIFTPIPDEPVAVDDDVVVVEDTPLNINVLSNDYDVDGTTPTIIFDNVQYIDPKHGSVAYVDDATLRYTPDQDYVGDDYFQYSITDELGYDAYATVTITVTPENDDPVAVEDLVFVQQESSLTFDPLVNDSDVENDALTITGVTDPSSGTVTIGQDGKSLSYSPKAGFKGNDSFDYTVSDGNGGENSATIDVIVLQNDPPVAVGDTITLLEDTPITFSPMINDTDLDGDSFNIQSVGTATFGALTNNGDGTLTYTPNANVNGDALEMVDYTIVDEFGRTSTAQITFNVTPVDDPTTGELLIKSTIDSFGNPFYEVDDSQLRDVEGIPGLFIQPTEPGGVGGFSGGNLFFEWIWKTASGVQIESGPWFDPFDDQYFGTTVTVEGTLTDGDGNTSFVKSAATAAIPRVWPIYFDPASPEIDIFIIFNEQYDPDNADPTRVLIDNFDINADEISFDKIPRDIALQAIRNAELGSAILSFEDGSTLVVEGEGVTPETLTVDHFILEDGNVDPTGTVIINGTAQAGQTLLADAAAVLDLDGITVATIAYQWQRDGSDIIGATAEGYLLTEGDVGADIRVVYSFTDDFGTDESVTSATIGPIAVDPTTVGESIFGTDNPEVLIGTSGGDTIFALSGDDVINAGAGNDTINGGEGFDRAIFSGNQLSYTVTITPTGTTITDRRVGGDGMDLLDSVELLDFETELSVFGNSPMNLDIFDGPATLNATEFAAITELYIAYFNRAPDAIGLYFWASVYADGFSLANMAVEFFKQPETKLTYAASLDDLGENLTDISTFVSSVYSNVLGRSFDEEGRDFWVGVLERQDVTPASFISEIIKGAKAAAGPDASQEFIDQKAADVAYLETKVDIGAYFAVLKGMSEVNNARAVMELYDGSAQSVQNTVAEIDSIFAEALDAENGEFLMQLIGVIDDPFSVA